MNIWLIISGGASLVVVLMCVAILLGRGDWLVYELRSDDRDKFNLARLRVVTAVDWISFICILLIAVIVGFIKGAWATK